MARLVDIVAALLWSVLLAPVMGAIALVVRMSSPGPAIVRERRRGNDGTSNCIYHFRTTYGDSSQMTDVGRFLWRSSLNELPSLINLLHGDATLKEYMDLMRR
jgi:lipopolysaccharide/colanic/teichoic acid biosynthesis glycosyltransferase